LPDQRKTNNWSTKKNKNEEEKECYIRWEERRIAIRYVYECIANKQILLNRYRSSWLEGDYRVKRQRTSVRYFLAMHWKFDIFGLGLLLFVLFFSFITYHCASLRNCPSRTIRLEGNKHRRQIFSECSAHHRFLPVDKNVKNPMAVRNVGLYSVQLNSDRKRTNELCAQATFSRLRTWNSICFSANFFLRLYF